MHLRTISNLFSFFLYTLYSTLIQKNTFNPEVLFDKVDQMIKKLPLYDDASCLAKRFADFFVEKIQTSRNIFLINMPHNNPLIFDVP